MAPVAQATTAANAQAESKMSDADQFAAATQELTKPTAQKEEAQPQAEVKAPAPVATEVKPQQAP